MDYPKEYPKMLAVAVLVIGEDGKILLNRRGKEPDQGKWQLFATYVKPGERLTEAVARRLFEDAGITETVSMEFTGRYCDEPNRHTGTYCIPFIFKVTIVSSQLKKPDECGWFTKGEATKLDLAMEDNETLAAMLL